MSPFLFRKQSASASSRQRISVVIISRRALAAVISLLTESNGRRLTRRSSVDNALRLSVWVSGFVRFFKAASADVGVDLSSREALVAQQLLNASQICPAVQ